MSSNTSVTLLQWPDHLVPIATHPFRRKKNDISNVYPIKTGVNDEYCTDVYDNSSNESTMRDSDVDETAKNLLLNLLKATPPCYVIDIYQLIDMNILNILQAPYLAPNRGLKASSPRGFSDADNIPPTFIFEKTPIAAVSLMGAVLEMSHNDDDDCHSSSAAADARGAMGHANRKQIGTIKPTIISFTLTIPNHAYRYILYLPPAVMMLSRNDLIQRRCSFCHGTHIHHSQAQIDSFMGKMKLLKHYIDVSNRHHMNVSNFQPCLIRIKIELMSQSSMQYFSTDMVMQKINQERDALKRKTNTKLGDTEDCNVHQEIENEVEEVDTENQNEAKDVNNASSCDAPQEIKEKDSSDKESTSAKLTEEELNRIFNLERRKFNRESCAGLKTIFVNISTEDPDTESDSRRRWDEQQGGKKKKKNNHVYPESPQNPRRREVKGKKSDSADPVVWSGKIERGEADKNKLSDSSSSSGSLYDNAFNDQLEVFSTNFEDNGRKKNEPSNNLIEIHFPRSDGQPPKKSLPHLASNIFKQNFAPYHKKHNNEFQFLNKNDEETDPFCPNRGFHVLKSTFLDSQKKTGASIALGFSAAAATQMHLRVGLDHASLGKLVPLRVVRPVLANVVGMPAREHSGGRGIAHRMKDITRNGALGIYNSPINYGSTGSIDGMASLSAELFYFSEEEKMLNKKCGLDTDGNLLEITRSGGVSGDAYHRKWHYGDVAKEIWWSKQAPSHSITIGEILARHKTRETAAVVELVSTNTTKTRMKYGADYNFFANKELIGGPIVRGRLLIWAEPLPQKFELFHFSLAGLLRKGGNLGPPTYSDPVMKLSVVDMNDQSDDTALHYHGFPSHENSGIVSGDEEKSKQIKEREREWELKRLRQIADSYRDDLFHKNHYISEGYRNRHTVDLLPIPIAYSTENVLDTRGVFMDATGESLNLLANLIGVNSLSHRRELLTPIPPSHSGGPLSSKDFRTMSSNRSISQVIASSLLSSKVLPPIAVVKQSGDHGLTISTPVVLDLPRRSNPVISGRGRSASPKKKGDRNKKSSGGASTMCGYGGTGYNSLADIHHEFMGRPPIQCPRSPFLTTYPVYKDHQLIASSHTSETAGRRGGNELLNDNDASLVSRSAGPVIPMMVCPKDVHSMRDLELFIDVVDGIRRSTIINVAEQQKSLQEGSSATGVLTVRSKIQQELALGGIRTALVLSGVKDDGVICPLRIAHTRFKIGDVIQSNIFNIPDCSTSLTALSSHRCHHQESFKIDVSPDNCSTSTVTEFQSPPGGFISIPLHRNYIFDGRTITETDQMNLMKMIYREISAACYSDFPPSPLRQFLEKRAMMMISTITDGNLLSSALLAPLKLLQCCGVGATQSYSVNGHSVMIESSGGCVGISEVDRKRLGAIIEDTTSGQSGAKSPVTNVPDIKSALKKSGGKSGTSREGESSSSSHNITITCLELLQPGNAPTANTLVPSCYRTPPLANITHIPFYRTLNGVSTPFYRSQFSFLDFLRSKAHGHEIHCVSALELGTRVTVFRKVTRYLDRSFNEGEENNVQKRLSDPLPSVDFEVEYQKVTKRSIVANHSPCFLNGWTAVEGILASLQQLLEPFVFRNAVSQKDKEPLPHHDQSRDTSHVNHSNSIERAFEESVKRNKPITSHSDCTNRTSMSLPPGDFLVFFNDVNVRQVCDDEGGIPDTNDNIDQVQPEKEDENSHSISRNTRTLYVREHSYESRSRIIPLNVEGELNLSVPVFQSFKYNPWHSNRSNLPESGRSHILYQPYATCREYCDLIPNIIVASPIMLSKNCDGSAFPTDFTQFKKSWFGISSGNTAPYVHQQVASENHRHSHIISAKRKGRLTTNISESRLNLSGGSKKGQAANRVKRKNSVSEVRSTSFDRKLKDIPMTEEEILNLYADGVERSRLVDKICTPRHASSGANGLTGTQANGGDDEPQTYTVHANKIDSLYEMGLIKNEEEVESYPLNIQLVYDEDFNCQYRHRLVLEAEAAETARLTLENQRMKELEQEKRRQKGNKGTKGFQDVLVDSNIENTEEISPDTLFPSEPRRSSEDILYERQEEEKRKELLRKQLASQRTLSHQHSSSNLIDVLEAIVQRCKAKNVSRVSLAEKENDTRKELHTDTDIDTSSNLLIESQGSKLLLNPRDQRLVFQHHHHVSSSDRMSLNPKLFHIGNVIVTHPIRKDIESHRASYFSSSPAQEGNNTDDDEVELVPQSSLDSILAYLKSVAHLPIIFLFIFVNCEAPEELGFLPNVITTDFISLTNDLLRELTEDKQSSELPEMITLGSPAAIAAYQSRTPQEELDLKVDLRRKEVNEKRWLEDEATSLEQEKMLDNFSSPISSPSPIHNKEIVRKTPQEELIIVENKYMSDPQNLAITEPIPSIEDEKRIDKLYWEQRALKTKEKRRDTFLVLHSSIRALQKTVGTIPSMFMNYCRAQLDEEDMPIDSTDAYYDPDEIVEAAEIEEEEKLEQIRQKVLAEKMAKLEQAELLRAGLINGVSSTAISGYAIQDPSLLSGKKGNKRGSLTTTGKDEIRRRSIQDPNNRRRGKRENTLQVYPKGLPRDEILDTQHEVIGLYPHIPYVENEVQNTETLSTKWKSIYGRNTSDKSCLHSIEDWKFANGDNSCNRVAYLQLSSKYKESMLSRPGCAPSTTGSGTAQQRQLLVIHSLTSRAAGNDGDPLESTVRLFPEPTRSPVRHAIQQSTLQYHQKFSASDPIPEAGLGFDSPYKKFVKGSDVVGEGHGLDTVNLTVLDVFMKDDELLEHQKHAAGVCKVLAERVTTQMKGQQLSNVSPKKPTKASSNRPVKGNARQKDIETESNSTYNALQKKFANQILLDGTALSRRLEELEKREDLWIILDDEDRRKRGNAVPGTDILGTISGPDENSKCVENNENNEKSKLALKLSQIPLLADLTLNIEDRTDNAESSGKPAISSSTPKDRPIAPQKQGSNTEAIHSDESKGVDSGICTSPGTLRVIGGIHNQTKRLTCYHVSMNNVGVESDVFALNCQQKAILGPEVNSVRMISAKANQNQNQIDDKKNKLSSAGPSATAEPSPQPKDALSATASSPKKVAPPNRKASSSSRKSKKKNLKRRVAPPPSDKKLYDPSGTVNLAFLPPQKFKEIRQFIRSDREIYGGPKLDMDVLKEQEEAFESQIAKSRNVNDIDGKTAVVQRVPTSKSSPSKKRK